ncbi:hypothetical protein SynSYN20_01972 [Synechococcus sp. SYN20]|nr:hypothetical protein SynSYN20_01972 [Synechococcus sp. SYN20]
MLKERMHLYTCFQENQEESKQGVRLASSGLYGLSTTTINH